MGAQIQGVQWTWHVPPGCISHMHAQESLTKLLASIRSFWLLASSNSVFHVKLLQMLNKIGSVV